MCRLCIIWGILYGEAAGVVEMKAHDRMRNAVVMVRTETAKRKYVIAAAQVNQIYLHS
jgi:hypothetical protein